MLRKPTSPPLPRPFADITASTDDNTRMRVSKMKLILDTDPGYSWNQPQETAWERFRANPLGFFLRLAGGIGMAGVVVGIFHLFTSHGFTIPLRIIYAESWGAGRTSEDALADRAALLARVERMLEAERQQEEAAAARQQTASSAAQDSPTEGTATATEPEGKAGAGAGTTAAGAAGAAGIETATGESRLAAAKAKEQQAARAAVY